MKKFSLIIPVYKQEKTIKRDITDIINVLSKMHRDFEIIPVIDGKLDKSTEEIKTIHDSRVHITGYQTNHGKGYAVRFGFSQAKGDVVGFMDAGGDLKPEALPLMLAEFEFQHADAIIGSKRHPDSKVEYPYIRKIISWVYQQITRILFGLKCA